ncbi:MAG: CBS domain-containing protein [Brevinematales bacterium]|nr:CBS domain-containing protein [Brevinematales bacterium]
MRFSGFLQPELYWTKIEVINKIVLLEKMVKGIRHEFALSMTDEEIVQKILQREEERPTILGECFWVPHFRIPDLEDLIIAVAFPKKPFAVGGNDIKGVFLILTGPSRSTLYLNALSALSTVVGDSTFCKKVQEGLDFENFCDFLDERNIHIKKDLTLRDIMSTEVHVVHEDQNLEEVLDFFVKYQLSYAPVVNSQNRFIAEINMIDIMRVGMPAYTSGLPTMNFLSSFEPFEELLKHEKDIFVRQIMRKPEVVLHPDTSIVEAVFEFTNHRRRHLPVADGETIVGVVSYMDMLNKVLRR